MVTKAKKQRKLMKKKKGKKFNRFTALFIIMLVIFSLITSKLTYLQIIKADEYKEMTSNMSIRDIPIIAPRGNITDSNGNILAESRQGYTIAFTETNESKENFFATMPKVFQILDKNGEFQKDDFELKINPYRFGFSSENPATLKNLELRFKKDRGLDDKVRKEIFPDKERDELNDEDKEKIDEELLKITPQETFDYLLDFYGINDEESKLIYTEVFTALKNDSKSEEDLQYYLDLYKVDDKEEKSQFSMLYKNMPEEVFEDLRSKYKVGKSKYSLELKRRFMLVKDAIRMQSFYGFKPVVIAANIKKDTAIIAMQEYESLPGIEVTMDPVRVYPYEELGSSFLGYLSKINPEQQEKYEEKGYDISSDYIGASGIESAFESTLRGSKGTKIVQINKYGRIMRELGRKEPYPGKTVQLTIDRDLQYAAEKSLEETMKNLQAAGRTGDVDTSNATRGAAVVLDVNTGDVLAMVSKPGYDPNLFTVPGKLTPELQKQYFNPDLKAFGTNYVNNLLKKNYYAKEAYRGLSVQEIVDKLFPLDKNIENNTTIRQDFYDIYPKHLYNYATKALTPPGSTFKTLTAVAALEEDIITPNEIMQTEGIFTKHGYKGRNLNGTNYGGVDLATALEKSINYYFFELGDRLYQQKKYNDGFDAIAHYAWMFGLGAPQGKNPSTGIEIPEKFGQVYNLETGRRTLSAQYLGTLLDLLLKGTDRRTPEYKTHYIGIDITSNENDEGDLRRFKETLRTRILEEMQYKNKGTQDIKAMLLELSEKDPKIKNNYAKAYESYSKSYSGDNSKKISYEKYVKDQIEKAWLSIVYSIDDANYNINNQNNVYDASIGQGINQFTPLQLANYIATLVNGGNRYKVSLVDKILDQDDKVVQELKPEVVEKINLKPGTVEAVKAGMKDVISEGTASNAFAGFPISNGGKTGSATYNNLQDQFGRTSYAVYTGFAPFENPEIAVCVLIFDGGHGGYAAPVARAIYEEYFKETLKKNYPNYTPVYNYNVEKDTKLQMEKTQSELELNMPPQ